MKKHRSAVMVLGILVVCGVTISLNAQTNRGKPVRPQGDVESPISQRLALVIGNSDYAEKPLSNPFNDAQDMAEVLEQLGFDVIKKTNLDHRGMKTAVRDFGQRLRYGGGVGLFYYAGHGFQYQNQNYLVPIGADIQSEADIEYELFHAGYVLSQMEYANNGMNIVILDACRSNPFRRSFSRDIGQGLTIMDAPKGAVIAFATAPNETAADGTGRNGTFTKHLLAALRSNPCRGISDLLIEVTGNVDRETNGRQVPWQHLSLTRPFQLADCEPLEPTPIPVPIVRQPTPTPTPPGKWTDPVTDMEFVWIKGGCFQMGQTEIEKRQIIQEASEETYKKYYMDELPRHQVCVDGFWMGTYEVTNTQYRKWKQDHDSQEYKGHSLNGDTQPVVDVSWEEATEFAQWLTKQPGSRYTFRLPTEAEWEYAVRAGTTTARFWGDNPNDACDYANVADQAAKRQWSDWTIHECNDGYAVTALVGQFRPNAFGLYDMIGNVWEWCQDWYDSDYYINSPKENPQGPASGSSRVGRGGGWGFAARDCRSAIRDRVSPGDRDGFLGFRLVRTP